MLLLSNGLFCLVREHWKQTLPLARVKLDTSGRHHHAHDKCSGGDVLWLQLAHSTGAGDESNSESGRY